MGAPHWAQFPSCLWYRLGRCERYSRLPHRRRAPFFRVLLPCRIIRIAVGVHLQAATSLDACKANQLDLHRVVVVVERFGRKHPLPVAHGLPVSLAYPWVCLVPVPSSRPPPKGGEHRAGVWIGPLVDWTRSGVAVLPWVALSESAELARHDVHRAERPATPARNRLICRGTGLPAGSRGKRSAIGPRRRNKSGEVAATKCRCREAGVGSQEARRGDTGGSGTRRSWTS